MGFPGPTVRSWPGISKLQTVDQKSLDVSHPFALMFKPAESITQRNQAEQRVVQGPLHAGYSFAGCKIAMGQIGVMIRDFVAY